jgi:hypothetical protein
MSTHVAVSLILLGVLLVLGVLLAPPATVVLDRYTRRKSAMPRGIPQEAIGARMAATVQGVERPAREPPARADADAEEQARLMAASRQRLYDLARQGGIAGRSRMTREQLIEALMAAPTRPAPRGDATPARRP